MLIKEKESKLAVAEMVSAYTFPQFLTPFFFFVGNPGGAVMSKKGQALNKNISIVRRFIQQFLATIKRQIIGLLRTVFVTRKHQQAGNAGFVLPTVTMVSVVVVLLTTAIMFRSFDRAKNASNVRVNQMVMNSAAPAIDRAKAKLNKLFKDQRLSRATPTETELDNVLVTYKDEYTFGDERNLIVDCYDPSSGLKHQGICSSDKELKTAWEFPIDTDNNGKFDSYTLYGIYYKNPALSGTSFVKRNPVQARAIPMTITSAGGSCPNNNTAISASLAGVNGWFKGNKSLSLVKGFFVYTVTVPITSTVPNNSTYEKASNSKGFSALEYEQDKIKRSLLNNAVIYQDDLYLTAEDADFKLNGGIFTNGNLLAGSTSDKSIKIYQVSSPNSCFYEADNAKITVGGNIATVGASGSTKFDLFPGKGVIPTQAISLSGNESVTDATTDVAYNSDYDQRVNSLVAAQKANSADSDPSEVKKGIERIKAAIGLSSYTSDQIDKIRSEQLTLYFQKRTRRVPVKDTDGTTSPLQGTGDSLRPKDAWIYPTDPNNGKTGTGYTGLTLKTAGNTLLPAATEPSLLLKNGKEQLLGDRIRVGNNLPQLWWKNPQVVGPDPGQFVGPDPGDIQDISGIKWDSWDSNKPSTQNRYRFSRIQNLADAGSTDRDRDWELAAAKVPDNPQDPVGGLRVVTGAGIYLRTSDTAATTDFTTPIPGFTVPASTTIYDGALPEPPDANTPYLKMRASAVYHYKQAGYSQTAPKPIACVSSFYTKNKKNQSGLPPWTLPLPVGFDVGDTDPKGLSNNGIVYGPPTKSVDNYQAVLNYQSTLKNNGRSIDDGLLAGALAATNRTLSQQSTIDAAICALQILDESISFTDTVIPHGAIFEAKDFEAKDNEPLAFSSTVLNLGLLKGKTIGSATPSQEYLIPNSGIIYATRDDALVGKNKNAIILTNGSDISRESSYRDAEKGLIVATNLPLYIKGDFNLHTQEEFNTPLNSTWGNFYTRSDRNPNFACRPNDPKLKINGVDSCPIGDKWRSAAVISDSITLLSNNYGSLPLSPAADTTTTYNAILVSGDTEQCGTRKCGLADYVRFPENWNGKTAKISGIFMQQKKSIYDTSYTPNSPPIRNWSYDVGILRQSPDLLAQKLIADTSDPPNEYFREVDRDDPWIQNLLCAKDNTNTSYIIDKNQRPSMCQS
jgi:hypothetical protein